MSRIQPPSPKGRRLLGVIAESIARGEIREGRPWTFLGYSTALERLSLSKPDFRAGARLQKHGLTDLNDWTREYSELPKIAALIVEKHTMRPNPRFADSHGIKTAGTDWLDWWLDQANLSIRFDWSPYVGDLKIWAEGSPDFAGGVAEDRETLAPDVRDVLRWLAAGQSEAEILRLHPDLTAADIRRSLAWAADRLKPPLHPWPRNQSQSTLASRWAGKFTLPDDDPADARLSYLLDRYRRHRE